MQLITGFPFFMLLVLASLGLVLFLAFRLYRKWILPGLLLKESGRTHGESVTRIEIVVWTLYFAVVIDYALVASLLVTLVLLTLVLLAFFDFWRNYFSGIILRLGDKLQIGDSISLNGYSGKILKFGNRTLKMITPQGEEMLIPYRLIDSEVTIGQKSKPEILNKTFVVEPLIRDHPGTKQQIEQAIYSNPWIVISSPISIALEDQRATLNFYVLNPDFYEKAKHCLLKDLESLLVK